MLFFSCICAGAAEPEAGGERGREALAPTSFRNDNGSPLSNYEDKFYGIFRENLLVSVRT